MNILGCLDSPTRGKYYLEGIEASQLSKNELANIRNKKSDLCFRALIFKSYHCIRKY